jgi:hypothetical protein
MSDMNPDRPATRGVDVTLGTALTGVCRGLWVGTGGTLTVTWADGTTTAFANVANGALLPFAVASVANSGGVANVKALY